MTETLVEIGGARPEDRRRETMADWRRRSRLVARARRWLPIAMGVLLLGIVAAVIATAVMGSNADEDAQTTIRMQNARFLGRDEGNQAFTITAREAIRIEGGTSRIRLNDPVLTLESERVQPTVVRAQQGVYNEQSEILHLRQRVTLEGPTGRFNTEDAVVDPNKRVIVGSAPIQGIGPTGTIAANAYALYDGGERVVFSGNVKARLMHKNQPPPGWTPPASAPSAPAPASDASVPAAAPVEPTP